MQDHFHQNMKGKVGGASGGYGGRGNRGDKGDMLGIAGQGCSRAGLQ